MVGGVGPTIEGTFVSYQEAAIVAAAFDKQFDKTQKRDCVATGQEK